MRQKFAREHLSSAEERAAAMKDFKLTITAKAGTEGKLFGSIGTSDVAEAATKAGFKVERAEVRMPNGPLRTVGEHSVGLHLHADIDVPLSCESGICGTCLTAVIEGIPDHRDSYLTSAERAENRQMTVCCSRSLGKTLVLDI